MDFLKDLSIDKVRNLAEDAYNQAKPKTEVEARVYEVLSHKNWGSSSTQMNEVARDTFDYDKFVIVSTLMWESMENQRPAAWRVVFKGLTLLEHLLKNGSERVIDDARSHGHSLRALFQFNYYEGTIDRGSGVREKAKQLVEILSDDERIREERQKARKLREKFGGNLAGVSGGGGSSGGGGRYAGYGNDDWNSGGGGGGSGGYGDGGIGSERNRSGGGDRANGAYTGRYDDDRETARPSSSSSFAATPTFAAMPDEPKKSKGKKKKKKDESASAAPAPAAPEVDLFGFDDSATAAATAPPLDEFDSFQSASGSSAPATAAPSNDIFGGGGGGFDAFGGGGSAIGAQTSQPQQQQFNAFGAANSGMMMQHQQQVAPAMAMGGSSNFMGGGGFNNSSSNGFGGGGSAHDNDDDFGDFASSSSPSKPMGGMTIPATTTNSSSTSSADPLSKLISLEGLSKNTDKDQALKQKLNAPIIASPAAASFVQERDHIAQSMEAGRRGNPSASFAGLDGLPKQHSNSMMGMGGGMGMGGMNMMTPNMTASSSLGSNPNVMGVGGSDAISSLMDPKALVPPKPQPTPQQQFPAGSMVMNPQMMMQMQQGGFGAAGMQGMTPQQQQQMMMMMMMQQQQIQQQGMGMNTQGQPGFGGQQPQQGFGGGSFNNQMGGFR